MLKLFIDNADKIFSSLLETVVMLVISITIGMIVGLVVGVFITISDENGLAPNKYVNKY